MSDTINILHLSDLHYTSGDAHNQKIVLNALFEDLKRVCNGAQKPDFVIFSGDLVNAADEKDVYFDLHEKVLAPIQNITRCDDSRIILCAGNHDAQRTIIEEHLYEQKAMIQACNNRDTLNKEYLSGKLGSLIKQKFEKFHEIQGYFARPDDNSDGIVQHYSFPEIGDNGVEITCFNSAFATFAGLQDDRGNLLLPEASLIKFEPKRAETFRIAVTHHPLDWLLEFSRRDAEGQIAKAFNMHLYGHMHDVMPRHITSLNGECLNTQSGALYTRRDYYNGYSLISLDLKSGHIKVAYRSYYDKRKEFDVGTDICTNGLFFSSSESKKLWNNREKAVDKSLLEKWLMEQFLPAAEKAYNEGLTERPVCELFVPPTMYKYRAEDQTIYSSLSDDNEHFPVTLDELINSNANYVIHGRPEYGKTTLLKQIALRRLRLCKKCDHLTMPVMADFIEFKPGKDLLRPFRAALVLEPNHCSIKQLAEEGLLTIIIDDVDFSDSQRVSILSKLIRTFPRNKYILSTLSSPTEVGLPMVQDIDAPVSWEHIFLDVFSRKQMRSLIQKWGDNGQFKDQDALLNKLIEEFTQINLPITAANGTIILTIYEEKSSFRAINRAVLIERFMEHILEKRSLQEVSRGSFDFKNKELLLSHLASHMAYNNKYVLPKKELIQIVDDYLNEIGLEQESAALVEQFITARILGNKADDSLGFRYKAFLEYFIAQQMVNNSEFREWVLNKERYLSYINEIHYYSGIVRNDQGLLVLVSERFEELSKEAFSCSNWTPDLSLLDHFELPADSEEENTLDLIENLIHAPPMSQAERDEELEAELPRDAENRQEVFRPKLDGIGQEWNMALFLYSGIIKNLEAIPDSIKRKHLSYILHSWGVFTLMSLYIAPLLAQKRRIRINGIHYHVNMPRSWSETKVFKAILIELPSSIGKVMSPLIGTEKLQRQLAEPCLDEAIEPSIVRFYRATLLSDLKIKGWLKTFTDLATSFRSSPYLLEITTKKLSNIYRLGESKKGEELELRKAIADGVANLRGHDHMDRKRQRSTQMQKIKHNHALRLMKKNSAESQEDSSFDVNGLLGEKPFFIPEENA